MRHRQSKRLRQFSHCNQVPLLAVLLGQDVFLGRRQQGQSFCWRAGAPLRAVKAVEQVATDLILLDHHLHRLLLVERGFSAAAALGIGCQGAFQFMRQPQVVHHQSVRLVPEHPIDPSDGLHQAVAAHGLVHIHGVQAGRVKAGQPHIAHQHQTQRVCVIAETFGQGLALRLGANMRLPGRRVGGRAGHHDFDLSLVVFPLMPGRT